jgi:hypothetical protein
VATVDRRGRQVRTGRTGLAPVARFGGTAIALIALVAVLPSVAWAADLGGGCCADLEERIAELEQTAVRKGNRKVSLIISGQVGASVMAWDDGGERNQYVGDGPSTSRFRFEGEAKIDKTWSTGFFIELSADRSPLSSLDQDVDSESFRPGVSRSLWFVQNAKLGAVTVGLASPATGDTLYTNLGGQDVVASVDATSAGSNLLTRSAGIKGAAGLNESSGPGNSSLRWGRLAPDIGTEDRYVVRYDSPIIAGFVLQSSVAADDFWDVNLRYAYNSSAFVFAAQAGYSLDTSENIRDFAWIPDGDNDRGNDGNPQNAFGPEGDTRVAEFQASASVWHRTTGFFLSGAYQRRSFDGSDPNMRTSACGDREDAQRLRAQAGRPCENRPDFEYAWGSVGVRRNFFGIGFTSLYGEYATGWDGVGGIAVGLVTARAGDMDYVDSSRLQMFGFGIVQSIDAAAMDLYLGYRNYRAELEGVEAFGTPITSDIDDLNVVIGGARIRF